jgi:uncharacterized protein
MKTLPVILAAALLLPACASSPPTHFVTLAAVSPVGETVPALSFPVQVDAVHIPATIDRNAVVRLTGSNTLSIDDQDHWGAPLGEMTRNVLAQDLAKRLPARTVIMPDAPSSPNTEHIVVNIATFREEAHGQVRLKGSWTLLKGDPARPVLTRDIDLECNASGSDADEQAAAMSQLVGQLSDRIASDLAAARAADLASFPLAHRHFDSGALAGGQGQMLRSSAS